MNFKISPNIISAERVIEVLLQFTFDNFKSFKDPAILSLEPSNRGNMLENISSIGKNKALKSIAIYGANAAGKSNLFNALTSALLAIRLSNVSQVNTPLHITPYLFDSESQSKPTSFEFVFIAEEKKYVYGFSATSKEVIREYLYVYRTQKHSVIFERDASNNYRFPDRDIKKELEPVIIRNTPNKLFLSTATAWNCASTKAPYIWLSEHINTYSSNFSDLFPRNAPLFENDTDGSLKNFTNRLLHDADINIEDYVFSVRDLEQDQFLARFPAQLRTLVSTLPAEERKEYHIHTLHTVENNGAAEKYLLPLELESDGTKNLFMFSPVLKNAFEKGETLCVDEFDNSLHPTLLLHLIKMFHDPEINTGNAQLIFSTHTTSLLNSELFRKDQIYFVEKDHRTAGSQLYSLDDFYSKRTSNIEKSYLLGRYGAVPKIYS